MTYEYETNTEPVTGESAQPMTYLVSQPSDLILRWDKKNHNLTLMKRATLHVMGQ
jgi:hypothetical protein